MSSFHITTIEAGVKKWVRDYPIQYVYAKLPTKAQTTYIDIQMSPPLRNKTTCPFQYGKHATMIMQSMHFNRSSFSITMFTLASS